MLQRIYLGLYEFIMCSDQISDFIYPFAKMKEVPLFSGGHDPV